MIEYFINDLVLQSDTLNIKDIKCWLEKHDNYFRFLISESKCRKWSKWLNNKNTFIFPCVCPIREQDCIFIETYYKLLSLEETLKLCEVALEEHEQINELGITLLEWRNKYQSLFLKNNLETKISIKETSEPYKVFKLKIEDKSFDCFRRFQKTYTKST